MSMANIARAYGVDMYDHDSEEKEATMQRELTGAEIDTLYKLGKNYPHGVEAGDIPSKAGRTGLIERGWARYETYDGSTYLNKEGFAAYQERRSRNAAD